MTMTKNDDSKEHHQHSTEEPNANQRSSKRYFGRGGVKVALLNLLIIQPMHGYQMMKALEEQSGGLYVPSAGSIYPTLQMLVECGFVSVQLEDGGKKVYMITEQGRSALQLLPDKTRGNTTEGGSPSPKSESFRNEKIRLKLGLSNESFILLKLVTRAEQEASASKEQAEKLQRLLSEQQQQISAFLNGRASYANAEMNPYDMARR
jgi:DNA-binding PadR family transcriptional regulator